MALTQTQKASSLGGNLAAGTIKTDPSKYAAIGDLLLLDAAPVSKMP